MVFEGVALYVLEGRIYICVIGLYGAVHVELGRTMRLYMFWGKFIYASIPGRMLRGILLPARLPAMADSHRKLKH